MHCVLWSYPSPAGLTKEKADKLFADVADMYCLRSWPGAEIFRLF